MDTSPINAYAAFCRRRREGGRQRVLTPFGPPGGVRHVLRQGRTLLDFASNDYLGLSRHPELIGRSAEWAQRWGAGSTASRLVCGNLALFGQLEEKLAWGKRHEAALLLGSGFQGNGALLAALLDRQVLGHAPLLFSDRLNHASIHHGCRAAGVRQIRYRHNDLDHLERLLKRHAGEKRSRFILTETVFSMDGDRVDLGALIALKERYGAFLYLDEAHATGVIGPKGFGLSAAFPGQVDLAMGTFSKALGGFGAYACCSNALKAYLVQNCAGFIYATALPPSVLGAMDAALDLIPTMDQERARLLAYGQRLRRALAEMGLSYGDSDTQIVPAIIGPEQQAMEMAAALREVGILAVAIRPPTVPEGTSRLRFSLSATHTDADLTRLIEALQRLVVEHGMGAP
ncbi:MAG: 8-amino-7-oxononanoate synthase [Magnetococcales bacterium]|nr:8-amino-7-oxononanoate synthase [Magnetococcales bacterium]